MWEQDRGKQTDIGEEVLTLEMGRMILPGQDLWTVKEGIQEGEEATDGPFPSRKEFFLLRGISKKVLLKQRLAFGKQAENSLSKRDELIQKIP